MFVGLRPLLLGLFILVVLEQLYLIGLLAKKNNGKYYLRIEDTDKERSKMNLKIKLYSLAWLGIEHDGEEYIQSKNIDKHKAICR